MVSGAAALLLESQAAAESAPGEAAAAGER